MGVNARLNRLKKHLRKKAWCGKHNISDWLHLFPGPPVFAMTALFLVLGHVTFYNLCSRHVGSTYWPLPVVQCLRLKARVVPPGTPPGTHSYARQAGLSWAFQSTKQPEGLQKPWKRGDWRDHTNQIESSSLMQNSCDSGCLLFNWGKCCPESGDEIKIAWGEFTLFQAEKRRNLLESSDRTMWVSGREATNKPGDGVKSSERVCTDGAQTGPLSCYFLHIGSFRSLYDSFRHFHTLA